MPQARRQYVIGLGSNLGDRLRTLRAALTDLAALGEICGVSALYESAAVGPPQPDYLNAAVLLDSALEPMPLLQGLLAIERDHGRERRERWGPRTLDLDLLFSPGLELRQPGLTLPHPELARRAFALAPLLDVAPDAEEPGSRQAYADLFRQLEGAGLRRLETSEGWRAG
ncbi:MAG: 2-amino-4-hydroxy-6-hydroxymethyldihydropteridine diphosphokinase [Myxococcales bacterium]|nr:MAG: 2-amino-4-hydroxy-6-hydroxymethyldihydropteridine diphosphokinase [Myxococcales bacterium]